MALTSDKVTITVLRWEDGWRVMEGERTGGVFDYKVDAEEEGLKLASQIRASGQAVELLVQQEQTSEIRPLTGWATVH